MISTRPLVAIALLLPFACRTEARKDQEVFDCATTGRLSRCLEMRYGWPEREALLRAGRWRLDGR